MTKDNLTTGVNGQIRFRVAEDNLYAYLFGVAEPAGARHGLFHLGAARADRQFRRPQGRSALLANRAAGDSPRRGRRGRPDLSEGVSINDLRKNLPLLNDYMEQQCRSTGARYGIELDAALITQIDPPPEVDRALSAINSTRNQVAADISTARADAEQQITMSKRAVDIATNNAQAEVAPAQGAGRDPGRASRPRAAAAALRAYVRNMRIPLLGAPGASSRPPDIQA